VFSHQKVVRFFWQLGLREVDGEEDCDDADDVSGVADEPVKPVEDGSLRGAGVTPEKCHERLDEAQPGRDAAKNLKEKFNFKLLSITIVTRVIRHRLFHTRRIRSSNLG